MNDTHHGDLAPSHSCAPIRTVVEYRFRQLQARQVTKSKLRRNPERKRNIVVLNFIDNRKLLAFIYRRARCGRPPVDRRRSPRWDTCRTCRFFPASLQCNPERAPSIFPILAANPDPVKTSKPP